MRSVARTEARNALAGNGGARFASLAAASASRTWSPIDPTASIAASLSFHHAGSFARFAVSADARRLSTAPASATSAFAPKRSQSSSRSMTHTALGLAASSSSSATYCSGSSVQVSSCAPVMHMYPTHVCTISPSPGSRFAPSRGCSASVISSSSS